MANLTMASALLLTMSQSFSPITSTSNNAVLQDNNTPIVEISATSEEGKDLMAEYLEIIEKDAAVKAIFESDNVIAQSELISSLEDILESKDEYLQEKAKKEAEEKKAKEEAERKKKIEEAKKLESGNFKQISVCNSSSTKSYMDYRKITNTASAQYRLIHSGQITVGDDGLLYSNDGFIGVALGSFYGEIGDKFKFVLSNGQELNVIKLDEKSDNHTVNGCYHKVDSSVIEFVVHKEKAHNTFGGANGHPGGGNFNNISKFSGTIVAAYKYTK